MSSRRSSVASSITIQVSSSSSSSTTTTLTNSTNYDHEERIVSIPRVSTLIEPFPLPTIPAAVHSRIATTINGSPPPPPYQFTSISPSSSSSLNPLSFYHFHPPPSSNGLPFSTLTRVQSQPNFLDYSPYPPPPPSSTEPSPPPPPSYNQVPQTVSERCFVFGFICPLIWLIGISKYFYSERPTIPNIKDLENELGEEGERELGMIRESLKNWRQEEKIWSLRCAYCFGGFISLGLLTGIVISAVMGKL